LTRAQIDVSVPQTWVHQVGGKPPFDKLRANGQAFSFALSLSKGEFAPKLKWTPQTSEAVTDLQKFCGKICLVSETH
jgi:hypothetical protein